VRHPRCKHSTEAK